MEQYARVEVVSAPEVSVVGRAVSDLVHLIAELLDNATTFSEPEKKVTVRMTGTRKKELAIQITDFGVGMAPAEIEAANQRLADPPDLDVSVTRRMGLYVVARLAQRHNIQVRLRDNEDIEGGLIARVIVPAELVQPTRGAQTSIVSGTAGFGPSPAQDQRGGDGSKLPSRAGGIAGAFTGGMPRLRTDGSPATGGGPATGGQPRFTESGTGSFPSLPPPAETSSPSVAKGAAEQTTRWGADEAVRPPSPAESSGVSLFGDPFAEQKLAGRYAAGTNGSARDSSAATPPSGMSYTPVNFSGPGGAGTSRDGVDHAVDAPTERLPIYEAVLSQWFESNDAGNSGDKPPAGSERTPGPDEDGAVTAGADAQGQPAAADYQSAPSPATVEPQTSASMPAPARIDSTWRSPGDDGWQAAQTLLRSQPENTTSAGLPKRVPKAQLVPGSASSRPESPRQQAQQQRAPLPPRSADAVRGRMSSFQQGVRRGRHSLIDAYSGDQSNSVDRRQNEEQE